MVFDMCRRWRFCLILNFLGDVRCNTADYSWPPAKNKAGNIIYVISHCFFASFVFMINNKTFYFSGIGRWEQYFGSNWLNNFVLHNMFVNIINIALKICVIYNIHICNIYFWFIQKKYGLYKNNFLPLSSLPINFCWQI